ncbi:TPA: hypothetical protein ACQVK3_000681 [Serratia marcescens]|uniref:Uncharacterized protein n=1 Tax=Serratia nevei TaxID=2703794 RepID=A0ABT7G5K0_9GAMM|nr:hypothetical protein [Serratia nevei]HAU4290864.1 hypothetical protein [Serratia marcescens]MDK5169035.1 hypothetical protein [Serratia nevei]MDK5298529.1 hypothetical protein [Serratia nevei]MEC5887219.1 hypothetical protein [Serratia nevei]HAU4297482.1 hypothetical protein [Serratia marcescens]
MSKAYEKRLFNEYKRLMKSIKTSNDVWDKLIQENNTINSGSLFYTVEHLFSTSKENDIQVEIAVQWMNPYNGIASKRTLWINPKQ